MTKISQVGIAPQQEIKSEHILRILRALSGEVPNTTIDISGSLSSSLIETNGLYINSTIPSPYKGKISIQSLDDNYDYILPRKSGTFAMLSDIGTGGSGSGKTEIPDYSGSFTYSMGDIVTHNGGIFRSEFDFNLDNEPIRSSNTSSWNKVTNFVGNINELQYDTIYNSGDLLYVELDPSSSLPHPYGVIIYINQNNTVVSSTNQTDFLSDLGGIMGGAAPESNINNSYTENDLYFTSNINSNPSAVAPILIPMASTFMVPTPFFYVGEWDSSGNYPQDLFGGGLTDPSSFPPNQEYLVNLYFTIHLVSQSGEFYYNYPSYLQGYVPINNTSSPNGGGLTNYWKLLSEVNESTPLTFYTEQGGYNVGDSYAKIGNLNINSPTPTGGGLIYMPSSPFGPPNNSSSLLVINSNFYSTNADTINFSAQQAYFEVTSDVTPLTFRVYDTIRVENELGGEVNLNFSNISSNHNILFPNDSGILTTKVKAGNDFYQTDASGTIDLTSLVPSPPILQYAQIINLGDIGSNNIEDGFNAHTFIGVEDPVLSINEGYVLVNAIIDGDTVQYLFIGEGGNYGTTGSLIAINEDFALRDIETPISDLFHIAGSNNSDTGIIANTFNQNIIHGGNIKANILVTSGGSDGGFRNSGTNWLTIRGNQGVNFVTGNANSGHFRFNQEPISAYDADRYRWNARFTRPYNDGITETYGGGNYWREFIGIEINDTVDLTGKSSTTEYIALKLNPIIASGETRPTYAIKSLVGDISFDKGLLKLGSYNTTMPETSALSALGVDASGNVVKTSLGSGSGGGGSTDYISNVQVSGSNLEFTGIGNAFTGSVPLPNTEWNEITGNQKDVNLIGFTDGIPFSFTDAGFIYSGPNNLRNLTSDGNNTVVGNLYSTSTWLQAMVSHDSGLTWQSATGFLGTSVTKGSTSGVFINISKSATTTIKRSTNGDVFTEVPGTTGAYTSIATDNYGNWFIKINNSDYKISTDEGITWVDSSLTDSAISSFSAIGDGVWMYSSSTKVYKSIDNGSTWVDIEQPNLVGTSLKASTNLSGSVMAVNGNNNVYISNDYGDTFTTEFLEIGQIYNQVLYNDNQWLVLGSTDVQVPNGKFRMAKLSNDGGNNWVDIYSDFNYNNGADGTPYLIDKGWVIPYANSKVQIQDFTESVRFENIVNEYQINGNPIYPIDKVLDISIPEVQWNQISGSQDDVNLIGFTDGLPEGMVFEKYNNVPFSQYKTISYGNGIYMVVQDEKVYTSLDLNTWNELNDLPPGDYSNVVFFDGDFITLNSDTNTLYNSIDGTTWSSTSIPSGGYYEITTAGDKMFIYSYNYSDPFLVYSDLLTRASVNFTHFGYVYTFKYINSIYIGITYDEAVTSLYTSNDGITWSSPSNIFSISDIYFINNMYIAERDVIAGGSLQQTKKSVDLVTWEDYTALDYNQWDIKMHYDGIGLIALERSGNGMAISKNGTDWEYTTIDADINFNSPILVNDKYVSVNVNPSTKLLSFKYYLETRFENTVNEYQVNGVKIEPINKVLNILIETENNGNSDILTDSSLYLNPTTKILSYNVGEISDRFTWTTGSQTFTLSQIPTDIIYISVQGVLLEDPAQWTEDFPNKTITINDTLDVNDRITVRYKHLINL